MYIVAIAWLYVVTLMALTETSVVAGVASFVFYGLLPMALLIWLSGAFGRRRHKRQAAVATLAAARDPSPSEPADPGSKPGSPG